MTQKRRLPRGGVRLGDTEAGKVLGSLKFPDRNDDLFPKLDSETVVESKSLDAVLLQPDAVSSPPVKSRKKKKNGTKRKARPRMANAAEKEIYRQAGLLLDETPVSSQKSTGSASMDFGKRHFDMLKAIQIGGQGFKAETRCEGAPSTSDGALINQRIHTGAQSALRMIDVHADGYIGYDFGTSSTKVAVRWPFDGSLMPFAVPVPSSWQSGGSPHLWPTTVFYCEKTGEFSLIPAPGSIRLEGFKAAIISGLADRMMPGCGITYAQAAIAFVAMHAAYVLGSIRQRDAAALVSCFNIAVPVVAVKREAKRFNSILSAAMSLVSVADRLTLDLIKQAVSESRGALIPFEVHAELVGAIAGYRETPSRKYGPHMLIDCGSATLDIVTFTYRQTVEEMPAWAAQVETLGADAIRAHQAAGRGNDICLAALQYQDHSVCLRTREHAVDGRAFEMADEKYPYQVILTGGGIDSPLHRKWLDQMERSFRSRFIRPALGDLECEDGCQGVRLIIADGLARDSMDLAKLTLPGPEAIDMNRLVATAPHDPTIYH